MIHYLKIIIPNQFFLWAVKGRDIRALSAWLYQQTCYSISGDYRRWRVNFQIANTAVNMIVAD